MLKLDLTHTLAVAGIVLFIGYGIRKLIPPLARYNLPAPVIGGLLVSVLILFAKQSGVELVQFDTTLQSPLMIAFFTTIGFGASVSLLRVGGPQVILFFVISTIAAVAQNVLGILLSAPLGMHPLFGVLTGSVTLTGGPATGLAFAPLFAEAGVPAAASVAVAAAMVGIVSGGLIGGPIGTFIIERSGLRGVKTTRPVAPIPETEDNDTNPAGEEKTAYLILKNVVLILAAMWVGSWISKAFAAMEITLPAYIGAMIVAAVMRNMDDVTGVLGLSQRTIDNLGSVALSLFISMALMTLKLWEIASLALPLMIMLVAQVALIAMISLWTIHRLMGRDYDAAVMSSGFCGFMLGTTANAMANMEALTEKFGAAPRAFLVVPMVGAFFLDFTNALIITTCINIWK
ncbi:MAG: sodium/glutamate symporter [candidate division Zixibacteria bacterium]|nr:sodium/glutamate symporter [candidate division Zixibacteria bacterium]